MLTLEQRAIVASEVEQREYVVLCLGPNGGGIAHVLLKSDPHAVMWKPDFKGNDWQRLQAMAMVEWLADRITFAFDVAEDGDRFWNRVRVQIECKNAAAMESLVYELKEPPNGN